MLAALLHDIGQIKSCKNHAKAAKPIIEKLLKGFIDRNEIEEICEIVGNHMGKNGK